MKSIYKITFLLLYLILNTYLAFGQCEIYLHKGDSLFLIKKYEEAKRQYLNYKECKPNAIGIDEKIAECERLRINSNSASISSGTQSQFTSYPKPDFETLLKRDLIKRRIMEQKDGYFGNRWAWQIDKPEELKRITITNESRQGDNYILEAHLILQATGSSEYEANVKISYVLTQNNQWTIDFIENKNINIVKTGRYNNCITTEKVNNYVVRSRSSTNTYTSYSLQFTNSCDVNLVVGGQIRGSDGGWNKFSCIVSQNSTNKIQYNGVDYKIDFIERIQGGRIITQNSFK